MSFPTFNYSTHFSIVWAVTLTILTTVEWRALDREPMQEQIFLPFIERTISVAGLEENKAGPSTNVPAATDLHDNQQVVVEFTFNGPLFLACFFLPIGLFTGIGWLGGQLKDSS